MAYIWERAEWPALVWDSEVVLSLLSEVSELHGRLVGQLSMIGIAERNISQLTALNDEIISTSQIEGITLHAESVRSSVARHLGIEEDGLFVEDHYIEGLVDMMMDAVRNCDAPLSAERLFGWHAALFPNGRSGMYRITVADWRRGDEPMQVVSGAMGKEEVHYQAPPSSEVDEMMRQFITWCNESAYPAPIKAAVAHLWFITIHPFDDGNGRIARTISDMLLSRMDSGKSRFYSVSAEINRNKRGYYEALEHTQKGGLDITSWMLWFLQCVSGAIRAALNLFDKTIEKSKYWAHFSNTEINARQRKVINRLWDGFNGKLTSSKWAKICSCSQDTASRDIKDLLSKGMLKDSGERGRNTNYILPSKEEYNLG